MDSNEFSRFLTRVDLLDEDQRMILLDMLSQPRTAEHRAAELLDGAIHAVALAATETGSAAGARRMVFPVIAVETVAARSML